MDRKRIVAADTRMNRYNDYKNYREEKKRTFNALRVDNKAMKRFRQIDINGLTQLVGKEDKPFHAVIKTTKDGQNIEVGKKSEF